MSQRHVVDALALGHELHRVNYRDRTPSSGRQVDDTPFGAGGMVLRVDVVEAALRAAVRDRPRRAAGPAARDRARSGGDCSIRARGRARGAAALTLLSGRYEGFDERIVEHFALRPGLDRPLRPRRRGLAAMVLCDAVLRKQPGALGDERSAVESPSAPRWRAGVPDYTRPAEPSRLARADVLLSGHHARIAEWRRRSGGRPRAAPRQARHGAARSTGLGQRWWGRARQHLLGQGTATMIAAWAKARLRTRPDRSSGRRHAQFACPNLQSAEHSHRQPGAFAAPPGPAFDA